MMQSSQIQKDKLDIIERIIHLDDKNTLDYIKSIFFDNNTANQLTDEQKNIVRESTENYLSGNDKGKSWEEVKSNLLSKRNG